MGEAFKRFGKRRYANNWRAVLLRDVNPNGNVRRGPFNEAPLEHLLSNLHTSNLYEIIGNVGGSFFVLIFGCLLFVCVNVFFCFVLAIGECWE